GRVRRPAGRRVLPLASRHDGGAEPDGPGAGGARVRVPDRGCAGGDRPLLAPARRPQRLHGAARKGARGRRVSAFVQLPSVLREYTGAATIETDAPDILSALTQLAARHPALHRHLFTDAGELRDFVRVYLNDDDVRHLAERERTPVRAGDTILIVPSIAGGEHIASTFSRDEVSRYARHIPLEEVGWEGQQKLRAARIAIVGAGGLGSPAGMYLAAAGIGTIGLIDF